jgi:hypothetical protein
LPALVAVLAWAAMSVLVKARLVNGHVEWLRRERLLAAVLERVPPETRVLMHRPPPPSAWIAYEELEPIVCALDAIDSAAVLRMTRDEIREALLPPLMPVIRKVLGAFNASPARGLRLFNELTLTSQRGMIFYYREVSARACIMEVQYQIDREIPYCMFVSCTAGFEALVEICGVTCTIAAPERIAPAAARFHISW